VLTAAHKVKDLVVVGNEEELGDLENVCRDLHTGRVKPAKHQLEELNRGLLLEDDRRQGAA